MQNGGMVYLASDIKDVLVDMRDVFRANSNFVDSVESVDEFLQDNINPVPTEREMSVLKDGKPVWRASFVKKT